MSEKDHAIQLATEKVKNRWVDVVEPHVIAINEQIKTKLELEAGTEEVAREIGRLTAAVERNRREEEELRKLAADVQAFVEANDGKEADADDLREQADADSRLVLDRLSEELSLEEFLFALDELLASRKISLEDFMREVRDASRRQFMCKMERQKASNAFGKAAPTSCNRQLVA